MGAGWGRRRRTRTLAPLVLTAVLGTGACSSALDPVDPTVSPPLTATSVTITPVTPDGLVTGPGVTDSSIRLAVLVDLQRDRGLVDGMRLWQQRVNTSGGLCGRTVELAVNGSDGVPSDVDDAYRMVGRDVLGMVVLPPSDRAAELNASVVADQIPALTPAGTSAQLGPRLPLVFAATADIQAINAAAYLLRSGTLDAGSRLGVLVDDSSAGTDALAGLQWWAARNDVELRPGSASDLSAAGAGLAAVVAFGDAAQVSTIVAGTPAVVVTDIDGYDPTRWSADAVAKSGQVLISGPTPAVGADDAAVTAVTAAWSAEGGGDPGPRLLTGYSTGLLWASMVSVACSENDLTRSGVDTVVAGLDDDEAAPLLGPVDLATVVANGLPATRQSTLAQAKPDAPSGLLPLTELESAPEIDAYRPE